MLNGLSGSLLSHYFAEQLLLIEFAGALGEASAAPAFLRFGRWWRDHASQLGPASSLRAVGERAAFPLAEALGFHITGGSVLVDEDVRVALLVGCWTDSLDALWRNAVRAGLATSVPWCLCCNGREIRLVDAERTYSRAYLQFDLERVAGDSRLFSVFWGVLRAEAFRAAAGSAPLTTRIIVESARHGAAVGRSLRTGVIDSVSTLLSGLLDRRLRRRRLSEADLEAGFDESLTLVYRLLFLMFAEARGLVPSWHPIYRDHYTIESLREIAERPGSCQRTLGSPAGDFASCPSRMPRWIARRARHSTAVCSPQPARRWPNQCACTDEVARKALLALSTAPTGQNEPARNARRGSTIATSASNSLVPFMKACWSIVPAFAEPGERDTGFCYGEAAISAKSTGSFYTPQSITDYLVRRTLHPLMVRAPSARHPSTPHRRSVDGQRGVSGGRLPLSGARVRARVAQRQANATKARYRRWRSRRLQTSRSRSVAFSAST